MQSVAQFVMLAPARASRQHGCVGAMHSSDYCETHFLVISSRISGVALVGQGFAVVSNAASCVPTGVTARRLHTTAAAMGCE